ncbi:MAG: hypothetical protein ACM359_04870 [Bacillota bacterium]
MVYQPQLNEVEHELVLQLLESERRELYPEVRRSSASLDAHADLKQRLRLVNDLLGRLKECQGVA